jgi:hypothetical protein
MIPLSTHLFSHWSIPLKRLFLRYTLMRADQLIVPTAERHRINGIKYLTFGQILGLWSLQRFFVKKHSNLRIFQRMFIIYSSSLSNEYSPLVTKCL